MKNLGQRLRNKGTIVAVASGVILIADALGYGLDSKKIMTVIDIMCSIGISLGVLNNPVSGTGYKDEE